jgi:hypothetical protein
MLPLLSLLAIFYPRNQMQIDASFNRQNPTTDISEITP